MSQPNEIRLRGLWMSALILRVAATGWFSGWRLSALAYMARWVVVAEVRLVASLPDGTRIDEWHRIGRTTDLEGLAGARTS